VVVVVLGIRKPHIFNHYSNITGCVNLLQVIL